MERWRKGRFERTIKELSQFDNKKQEELETEFDYFDVDNSYPTSPFKGCNIVYKELLDWHKACKTPLFLTQYQRERLIGLTSIVYLSLQNCSTVTMVKTSIMLSVQQIRVRSSYCDITCESRLCSVKSIHSGKVAATPILKSVPSQFSPFIL